MQVLNIVRDFELQKMKETEIIKEYSEGLLNIANKVILLGISLANLRIVEKILVTAPEKFEATITTLENTKDIKEMKHKWQIKKKKISFFVVTCFISREIGESWLIDSGCTNHMTNDKDLFKELENTESKNVRIENDDYIVVKRKGTFIAITSCSRTKFITDVFYVPDIDQNLSSVGQLVEKGFKVKFMEKACVIEDATRQKVFEVKMTRRSFSLNPMHEEQ
ncbi:uncharacterized protein [Gossypium hirsutum]|uniref:Retrovirus-related Pol polyprotein from transposon TNT 1-94-like beta-barrel domain-containing protein n=1 Tax=Gossypium hirsutum TaxID=3635 RepID=A0A1U8KMA1_GOSHI|nr:uncharacterized protein LOC107917271 [Gossypium hirsutum]